MSAMAYTLQHLGMDTINGLFEFFGAVAAYKNVAALRRDRAVAGVYWPNFMFYTLWGIWNIAYYPFLGQWVSFIGGLAILSGTASWLAFYWYYRTHPNAAQQA